MLTTRFTRLVGCDVPIQQAGMGAASPPGLAAAVSNAGAFGMLGTARAGLNVTTFAALLEQTRKLTTRPFGVNFIMRQGSVPAKSPREFIEQAAKTGRVVEFFYTEPSAEFVRIVHDQGALASWQVGSAAEALAAADVGCDLVVAQSVEAGGHVRGTIGPSACSLKCSTLCPEFRSSQPGESVVAGQWRQRSRQVPTASGWERGSSRRRRPASIQVTPRRSSRPRPTIASTRAPFTWAGRRHRIAPYAARSTPRTPSRVRSWRKSWVSTAPSLPCPGSGAGCLIARPPEKSRRCPFMQGNRPGT